MSGTGGNRNRRSKNKVGRSSRTCHTKARKRFSVSIGRQILGEQVALVRFSVGMLEHDRAIALSLSSFLTEDLVELTEGATLSTLY